MITFPEGPSPDVLILGAGFSKALARSMPLTDDLGNQVLADVAQRTDIPLPRSRFEYGRFESWLSRIAEDQPDLSVAANLSNRVLFQLCSESLAVVLNGCALDSIDDAFSHTWLFDLVGTAHVRRSTIITFNQDTLLELALQASEAHAWDQRIWQLDRPQPKIGWWDCTDGLPPLTPTRAGFGIPQPTLKLLKLHGSTNWYWRVGDESGATTVSWFPPGVFPPDQAIPDEASVIRRELQGRVPLIVPPAASKSAYYRTPLISHVWQEARKALSQPRVNASLLGYSIPPTDLVTSGMLRETLFERDRVPLVDIVNPDPHSVLGNLRAMGANQDLISTFEAVDSFVSCYVDRAAMEVVQALRESTDDAVDCLTLTGADIEHSRKVVGLDSGSNGDLELRIEDSAPPYTGPNLSPSGRSPAIPLRQLLEALDGTLVERLIVVTSNGLRRPVVGAAPFVRDWGAGNGRWQVLITAQGVQ